jgi:hypothetical protein
MAKLKEGLVNYLTLFTSMSTLICCALPALLVSLGLGAVLAGLASRWPSLIWISEHKLQVFILAGVMLGLNGLIMWFNRNAPCPIDPKLRDACIRGRSFGKKVYIFSVFVFLTGFFFAYLAPILF